MKPIRSPFRSPLARLWCKEIETDLPAVDLGGVWIKSGNMTNLCTPVLSGVDRFATFTASAVTGATVTGARVLTSTGVRQSGGPVGWDETRGGSDPEGFGCDVGLDVLGL